MKTNVCIRFTLVTFLFFAGFTNYIQANDNDVAADSFSMTERWDIKRQAMSMPGVMLDMANMTDNGYTWSNDVLWEGEDLPTNAKWLTAGFFFERNGYKSVWLEYSFQVAIETGKLTNFRRLYGSGTFR